MTTRAEKLERPASPAVLGKSRSGLLFLRFGRSNDLDPLSTGTRLARKLRNQGYILNEESIRLGESPVTNLISLVRLARKYSTIHLFFERRTAQISQALPAIILARFFGCRLILSFTGPIDEPLLGHFGSIVQGLLSFCDVITVPSAYHQKSLKKYNISARQLDPVLEAVSLLESDNSSIVPTVLVALPLEESSNIPSAMRAVDLVKQKYPRTQMVILGSGSQRERLESIASAINHNAVEVVTAPSWLQFSDYLKEADIFLCSSLDNYLPPSLIHALHFGIPVVAVTNGVISELITNGVNGLLTERGDHVALAEKLFELIESEELRRSLADKGRRSAESDKWDEVPEEYCSLYS